MNWIGKEILKLSINPNGIILYEDWYSVDPLCFKQFGASSLLLGYQNNFYLLLRSIYPGETLIV